MTRAAEKNDTQRKKADGYVKARIDLFKQQHQSMMSWVVLIDKSDACKQDQFDSLASQWRDTIKKIEDILGESHVINDSINDLSDLFLQASQTRDINAVDAICIARHGNLLLELDRKCQQFDQEWSKRREELLDIVSDQYSKLLDYRM